jgi:hypothetical protein
VSGEPFTLDRYESYLRAGLDAGYRFVPFDELDSTPPLVVLRHDVDYSPPHAVEMARRERAAGVIATYCVHAACRWYDASRTPHREAIETVLGEGHALGLHFDASEIADDAAVAAGVVAEAERLESLFGTTVIAVSFHMPGRRPVGHIELPPPMLNTYGPRFFDELAYVSDSNQDWRGNDDPAALLRAVFAERVQMLIHPFWWRDRYGTIGDKLSELAASLSVPIEEIATWEQMELIRAGR